MTTHKVSAETFFTLPTEAPARFIPVSPDTSAFFHRGSFAPDPMLNKHFGEGHTVKPDQPTRVLPRHTGRSSHITIHSQVWFSYVVGLTTPSPYSFIPPLRRLEEIRSRSGKVSLYITES
jgi:hypothetical protein